MMPYIWLVVIVGMSAVEAATAQMVSIWFVVGAVAAFFTSIFVQSAVLQIFVFILVSAGALILTRPFIKRMLAFKKEDTNAGRYIGKAGVVTDAIDNQLGKGQVNVCGNIWSARSASGEPISAGTHIWVEAIEGVKLIVRTRDDSHGAENK